MISCGNFATEYRYTRHIMQMVKDKWTSNVLTFNFVFTCNEYYMHPMFFF